jgi:hypothetical protein
VVKWESDVTEFTATKRTASEKTFPSEIRFELLSSSHTGLWLPASTSRVQQVDCPSRRRE